MIINKVFLKSLNPCTDRYKNFLAHYSEFEGTFDDFLDLEHVSYDDKIWVSKKVLNKNQLVNFAILCAESVLNIFESKYPDDKRVRNCIEYLKTIHDFTNLTDEQIGVIGEHRCAAAAAYATGILGRKEQEQLNLQFLKMAGSL